MGKVSVGLRGWRFNEDEIFTDDEQFKPLDEIPKDPKQRLLRLLTLVDKPCDCCYLIHGERDKKQCNPAAFVYGEPMDEVLLCADHEPDFIYWYQEAGGSELRGKETFADAFHQWFADGNRAPEAFGGTEVVETDPEALPELPNAREIRDRLEADYEPHQIDLRQYVDEPDDEQTDRPSEDELAELDLETEYPSRDE